MSFPPIARTVRNAGETDRRPPPLGDQRICRVRGCVQLTSERKPYCVAHISNLPYVKGLLEELARREAEDAVARQDKAGLKVDPDGVLLIFVQIPPEHPLRRDTRS